MNARITNRFRRRLLAELGQNGRLLGQLKKSVAEQSVRYMENGGAFANHMADTATEESDRESDSLLMDAQGRLIYEIEQALQRMEEGRFGACEACGRPIEERRIEFLPQARFCLRCQEREERIRRN